MRALAIAYSHCFHLTARSKLTCKFNKQEGTSWVVAFALSTSSIPNHGHVVVQYTLNRGVSNNTFPVAMQTYPASEAPRFRSDSSPVSSLRSPDGYDTGNVPDANCIAVTYTMLLASYKPPN